MIRTGPRVRASHTRVTARVLSREAPDGAAEVMALLPRDVREGLSAAGPAEWIPAAWDAALLRAMRAALGPVEAHRLARLAMAETMVGGLLGSLARTATRLFGPSPGAFFGWAGHAWAHLCRDAGAMRLESRGPGEAVVVLSGMPPDLASTEYVEAIAACLGAILDVCEVEGEVRAEPAPDGGRLVARWRA